MKYKDFRKYIKIVSSSQMEEYSTDGLEEANQIYGLRNKKFVRFSSELFSDLISELRNNPNCSYETYLNDVIKDGYTPGFISVILKGENKDIIHNDTSQIGHLREAIASNMMNFFGCPTTYDTLIDVDGEVKCCSVDFNRSDETLYIADELSPFAIQVGGVGELMTALSSKFKNFAKEKNLNGDGVYETDFMREYVYSYLVRKFILVDRDFGFHNVGIIHNEKNKTLSLAPNFDYEYTFMHLELSHNKLFQKTRINDLMFIQKYYPSTYKKFLIKYGEFVDENKYEDIIKKAIGKGKKSQRFIKDYKSYLSSLDEMLMLSAPKM